MYHKKIFYTVTVYTDLIGHDSYLPHARLHTPENLLGTAGWSSAVIPLKLSPTQSHDDFNFEELLSDLITIARTSDRDWSVLK